MFRFDPISPFFHFSISHFSISPFLFPHFSISLPTVSQSLSCLASYVRLLSPSLLGENHDERTGHHFSEHHLLSTFWGSTRPLRSERLKGPGWSQRRLALSVPLSRLTSLVRRGSA